MDFYFTKNDKVDLSNWRKPPYNRWSFSNVSELVPSSVIQRHASNTKGFNFNESKIKLFNLEHDGETYSLEDWFEKTYGDGIVIVKNGNIIYEKYDGATDERTKHILMSVSKSILGLVTGALVEKGMINLTSKVEDIIPELEKTAYKGASIQDVLDMRASVLFDENYEATSGAIIEYRKSHLWDPLETHENPSCLHEFLGSLDKSDGKHNGKFHYVSTNTDLLGWIIEESTGIRYSTLLSDYLWKPMGAEEDAYITVDSLGAPRCAGGVCATVRDLAKIGLIIANEGKVNGREVIPKFWVDDIVNNGSSAAWESGDFYDLFPEKNMHYRNQWYVEKGSNPLVFAVGVFGQNLFVDTKNNLIVAKVSSQPSALDKNYIDLTHAGINHIKELTK